MEPMPFGLHLIQTTGTIKQATTLKIPSPIPGDDTVGELHIEFAPIPHLKGEFDYSIWMTMPEPDDMPIHLDLRAKLGAGTVLVPPPYNDDPVINIQRIMQAIFTTKDFSDCIKKLFFPEVLFGELEE